MNEQELKEIWKSVDADDLPMINFEEVQKNIIGWHGKLRRKIKVETLFGILTIICLIPLGFALPQIVYYYPFVAIIYIWWFWEIRKIYRQQTITDNYENTKEFLENKISLITNYIKKTRLILYLTMPFIAFSSLLFNATLQDIFDIWWRILLLLIVIEILVVAYCEIYFRIMYFPLSREAQKLIDQLESE